MPQQGKFTAADLDQPPQSAKPQGQFTAADLDSTSADATQPPRGFLARAAQSLGIPTSWGEAKQLATPATIGGVPVAPGGSGAAAAVNFGKNLYQKGKAFVDKPSVESAMDAGTALTPGGANQKTFAQDVADKNYSGAAGTATGTAAQFLAPEVLERTGGFQSKLGQTAGVLADPAIDAASKLPVVGKVVDAVSALGKYKKVPGQLADIWGKRSSPIPEAPTEAKTPSPEPVDALGSIPVNRGQISEQLQAQPEAAQAFKEGQQEGERIHGPLSDYVAKPQTSAPVPRGSIKQMMGDLGPQLRKSMDVPPPPDPKQPIYQRGSLSQAMQEGTPDMPQGHTAHQSSALRSSMYDAGANEFHARMTSGDTTYVYGDVSPDEAQTFSDANSKGQAYQQIKSGHPLVAKIVNGKRVAVKGAT